MDMEKLEALSFEQLDKIQDYIFDAKRKKEKSQVTSAIDDILDLLNTKYPDLSYSFLISELTRAIFSEFCPGEPKTNFDSISHNTAIAISGDKPRIQLSTDPIVSLIEHLKTVHESVLESEDSRLFWLTNSGYQKTSKMCGQELADMLESTIKRLERLLEEDNPENSGELLTEILNISEWSEVCLGVSLIKGIFTVISPFSSRRHQPQPEAEPPLSGQHRRESKRREINLEFSSSQRSHF